MPSSGKLAGKRKRTNASLPPPKKHRPGPKKTFQNKIRGPLKWFLRSRKNEKIDGPSTSSASEMTVKRGLKRNISQELCGVESRRKQSRKNKEVNELNNAEPAVSEIKDQTKSSPIRKIERPEDLIGDNHNLKCIKEIVIPESEIITQGKVKNDPLDKAANNNRTIKAQERRELTAEQTMDELSENVNNSKENKSDSETLTTDKIYVETNGSEGEHPEQLEHSICEREAMEKLDLILEAEDTKLEFNERLKEDELSSKMETEEEEYVNETGNPSIAQETPFTENSTADKSVADSSNPSLSVSQKMEIPPKNEEKLRDSMIQRNPCIGSCDETDQYHWQVGKAMRMENKEVQCCKPSGGVLAGVGLAEHAEPPITSLQEDEEWNEDRLMTFLDNSQCVQPPFPMTLNDIDLTELERLLDLYEEDN